MKNYHIVFFERASDRVSTGVTIPAKDELQALELFRQRRPDAVFLHMASPEMMAMVP